MNEPEGEPQKVAGPRAVAGGAVWRLYFARTYPSNDNTRRSMHFQVRAKEDREWHERVLLEVLDKRVTRGLSRVRLSFTFFRRQIGRADPDNDGARRKPIIDGLVKAGVIPNDTYQYVELGPVSEAKGERGCAVLIEDLSAEVPA